ncbi:GFA family protein [Vibrio japonicus]|uniref:GFA family protein n=1 Tax=Vibrio japonicus TaxID=1824638 RepID=A0ABY5LIT4_9VIBR|nr:GFA family protein [Vibrio japonicus]UUM31974.1 GFA family protein [Vibrio japonicus]
MSNQHQGSCLCGGVQFELTGEFDKFFLCHCQRCQKGTGSVHAANLFSHPQQFKWLKGEELVTTYRLPDTRHSRSFCSNCGSAVPTYVEKLGLAVVPAGCLDTEVDKVPDARIYVGSAASWTKRLDNIPSFDQFIPSPDSAGGKD